MAHRESNTVADGGVSPASRREDTRRALLGKAALVGGGLGVVTLARSQPAAAASMLTGYFDVKDYGATGNGSTDDKQKIQDAITAADNAGGGVVWFPPGTYMVSGRIQCKTGVWLRGAGSKSVIKATNTSNEQTVFGFGVNDVTISDLVIDGNRTGRTGITTLHGNVRFDGTSDSTQSQNIHVHDCEIRESLGIGCTFINVKDASVMDCWVHGCGKPGTADLGDGIDCFYNCENIRYQGNLIEDTTDDAIGLNAEGIEQDGSRHGSTHALRRVTIVGNVVAPGTEANSCFAASGAKQVVVDGNVFFQGQGTCVSVRNFFDTPGEDVTITNNVVIDGGVGGSAFSPAISLIGAASGTVLDDWGSAGCNRIVISDNVIKNPRWTGISLTALGATTNGPPAAQLPGTLNDVHITGNVVCFDPSGTPGVTIDSGARAIASNGVGADVNSVVIGGNTSRNARAQAILVTNRHNNAVICGNTVLDSGFPGQTPPAIRVDSTGVKNVQIANNRCTDTRATGKTQSKGLELDALKGSVQIVGNDFSGNATTAASWSNQTAADLTDVVIADNVGWTPWSGRGTASGSWTSVTVNGTTYFRKDLAISFGISFPAGANPNIQATIRGDDPYWATVRSVSASGFTARIWSTGKNNPGSGVSPDVDWIVRP
jgi:Pectate lyase superfamily protein/Right handed beta helix region